MSTKEDIGAIFEEQSKVSKSMRATLEQIPAAPDKVKVTPYDGLGCGCDSAMIVAIAHVESVERTSDDTWHDCCGKRLRVCNVTLKPEATVLATDLLARGLSREHLAHSAKEDDAGITSAQFHPDRPACSQCWSVAPQYREKCWQICAGSPGLPSQFHPERPACSQCWHVAPQYREKCWQICAGSPGLP